MYSSPYQHPSQHGFIHGRGTDSAWKEIHKSILRSRNVFEFDLKEFFDRVNLDYLSKTLKNMKVPNKLIYHMISWSRTMPQNMEKSTDIEFSNPNLKKLFIDNHEKLSKEEYSFYETNRIGDWKNNYCYYNGVAQGSPLSPTLSTLVLIPLLLLNKLIRFLFYADDGAMANNRNKMDAIGTLKNIDPASGIEAHLIEPKSR